MSNRFSCYLGYPGSHLSLHSLVEPFLGISEVMCNSFDFFYCAQPNATSASIQNVKTNLREYFVKRLKICFVVVDRPPTFNLKCYSMFFVLNVPQDYIFNPPANMELSSLPIHTIPENVLYYELVKLERARGRVFRKNVEIDIKKPFKVSPSYKLVFLLLNYVADNSFESIEGTAQVFFDVN